MEFVIAREAKLKDLDNSQLAGYKEGTVCSGKSSKGVAKRTAGEGIRT
jgi:hypothetical protein